MFLKGSCRESIVEKMDQVWIRLVCTLVWGTSLLASLTAVAQYDINEAPILYKKQEPTDRVAQLVKEIESGKRTLEWDQEHGWLPDLLDALEIPKSSQTLVFSKTSLQSRKINPTSARALYFNEDVYLGFVHKGDFLEFAAVDPVQGAIFYTLDQEQKDIVKIKRATAECLSCHQSHKTQDVPGFLVRSVFPKKDGHPDFRMGTTPIDHRSPFEERFGGWFVTGKHGEMRHRGNVIILTDTEDEKEALNREAGANLDRLPAFANEEKYLEPTSDIVALMVFQHQTQFHNYVTQASYTTRQALHYQRDINKVMERDPDYRSESTTRRINSAAEELVEYLFFCDEFQLTSPVHGSSSFAEDFARQGVRDGKGRSLKDLDLQQRLLRYPCSYMVYSEAFCALEPQVLSIVKSRMLEILEGRDQSKTYEHVAEEDRKIILSILKETHPLFQTAVEKGSIPDVRND